MIFSTILSATRRSQKKNVTINTESVSRDKMAPKNYFCYVRITKHRLHCHMFEQFFFHFDLEICTAFPIPMY